MTSKKYTVCKRNGVWQIQPPYPVKPIKTISFEVAIRIVSVTIKNLYNPKAS